MSIDAHDPRAPKLLTKRSLLLTLAVVALALLLTAASVYLRRPMLERTRQFLGADAVEALQLGSVLEVGLPVENENLTPNASLDELDLQWTDLSDSPGVAMFRRALLDERHYDWTTRREESVRAIEVENPEYAVVRISGEIPHTPVSQRRDLETKTFLIEMNSGWMGSWAEPGAVRFTERVQPAVRNFIMTRRDSQDRPSR